jgi:hypothetical protein
MGGLLIGFELYNQALIPLGYVVITIINIAFFYRHKSLIIVRIVQIDFSILLPFALQLVCEFGRSNAMVNIRTNGCHSRL